MGDATLAERIRRGTAFRALHAREGLFVLPNPWDVGSARLLAWLGYEALATTSAGFAFSLGKADSRGAVTREETLAHARALVEAVPLPVSADLENGFGDAPEACAETIRQAAGVGLVGGSIEDYTGSQESPVYPLDQAVERVAAAVAAARAAPFPFLLTARAENFLRGRPDLADTIRRLEAFAAAGADVLYAPGLKAADEIAAVVRAVAPRPVNVVMGLSGSSLSLRELEDLGVRRVSVGSALARVAYGAFLSAAREVHDSGTFTFVDQAVPFAQINALFSGEAASS